MFDTHKVNEAGFQEIAMFKTTVANAVNTANALMPEGREKAIFMTKLEEAVFFGTKAIAAKAGNHTEVTTY